MSVPAAIANAVADALGRDDVEPPLTPAARLGAASTVKPAPFAYSAPGHARGGTRHARATRRRGEGVRRRAEPRPAAEHAPAAADPDRRRQRRCRLDGVSGNDGVALGASEPPVRQADARLGEHAARRGGCLPHVGHLVTRNRGTVGGSIAHADAAAELPLALLALGGSVVAAARRRTGARSPPRTSSSGPSRRRSSRASSSSRRSGRRATGRGRVRGVRTALGRLRAGDGGSRAALEDGEPPPRVGVGAAVDRPTLLRRSPRWWTVTRSMPSLRARRVPRLRQPSIQPMVSTRPPPTCGT